MNAVEKRRAGWFAGVAFVLTLVNAQVFSLGKAAVMAGVTVAVIALRMAVIREIREGQ